MISSMDCTGGKSTVFDLVVASSAFHVPSTCIPFLDSVFFEADTLVFVQHTPRITKDLLVSFLCKILRGAIHKSILDSLDDFPKRFRHALKLEIQP